MTAISTKGVIVQLQNGSLAGTVLVVTAISKTKPAVITAANNLEVGDVVTFGTSTGFSELNGKSFIVTNPKVTEFSLAGTDLTKSPGPMSLGVTATAYPASDFVNLCLSQLNIGASTANPIDVGTLCGSATITGVPTLGQLTVGGYVDPSDPGYIEILAAEADGKPRVFKVLMPSNYGVLIGVVTIGSVSWTVPLQGGIAWSATASQNTQIRYATT